MEVWEGRSGRWEVMQEVGDGGAGGGSGRGG